MLVEAPLLDREHAWGPMQVLYKTVARSNARRKTSWSSVEEAMDYFKRRFPCKVYHPEVWQIMSVRVPSEPQSDVLCSLHDRRRTSAETPQTLSG